MATVAQLVEEMSDVLLAPIADIHHRARRLREAGLLPAEGRGRGAPHVDARDCAVLLAGVLATDTASQCPEAVKQMNALGRALRIGSVTLPRASFVDVIAYLIERMCNPETVRECRSAVRRVGVSRFGEDAYGWVEPTPAPHGFLVRAYYPPRKGLEFRNLNVSKFGSIEPGLESLPRGLTREAYIRSDVLHRLALFLERAGGLRKRT